MAIVSVSRVRDAKRSGGVCASRTLGRKGDGRRRCCCVGALSSETTKRGLDLGRGWDAARVVQLEAKKSASVRLKERERPIAEYMALPASQYSVLDARRVIRTSDDTFSCYVGELSFFQWKVEPVLSLQVVVLDDGCEINLLDCRITGSPFVESQNDKFAASMSNRVRWSHIEEEGKGGVANRQVADEKQFESNIVLNVNLEMPAWFKVVPKSAVRSVGNSLLQGLLNTMVPSFLAQLETDYSAWASGDDSRKPLGSLE